MFKKFFKFIKSIFNYIREKKIEEFRREKNIYYVPEDFHTNPKYKVFDNFHSVEPKHNEFILKVLVFLTKTPIRIKATIVTILSMFMGIGAGLYKFIHN